MKTQILVFVFLVAVRTAGWGQAAGDYRTAATGNWNAPATWERFDGSSWMAAVVTPTSADGAITIRSPHSIAISANGLAYDQLTVEAGGQVTVNPTVTHTLANGSGTDLTIHGTWLNAGGAWTVTGATWTVAGGGTFIHNTTSGISTPLGAATLDAASSFIYRGSSTLTPTISVSNRTYGNLAFESASGSFSVTGSGSGGLTVNGNFSMGTGVTYITSQTGIMAFGGNFTNNGTITNSTGTQTYTFTGTGKSISGTSSITFETWNVSSFASITLSRDVIIATGFTGTVSGTLFCGTYLVTESGAATFTMSSAGILGIGSVAGITLSGASGNIQTTNRNFAATGGYIYNGAGTQTTGNGIPATVGSLTVGGTAALTLANSALTTTNGLTIGTGTSLTVAGGKSLSVGGALIINAEGNTGLVVDDGASLITNGAVTGGATVKRTITGPAWHLMSAPVSLQPVFAAYTDMYAWDEVNNLWLNHNGGTFPDAAYLPGKGYLVSWNSGATGEFSGTPNTGNYTTGSGAVPGLTFSSGFGNGYNLLGNPYPSAIIAGIDTWTKTSVDASVWVYDNGNYLTWNGITGTLTGGIIPAMQGFWVKASAAGASLTIPNSARTTNSQPYYKASEWIRDLLILEVKGNGYRDGVVVNFNPEATCGYDNNLDVRKLHGDPEAPQLFCLSSEEELSIDVIPYSPEEVLVPVHLNVGKDGSYNIGVKEITFLPTVTIFLEDLKEKKTIDLQRVPEYYFTAAVSDSPGRFRLHFGGTLSVDRLKKEKPISIYSNDNSVYITNNCSSGMGGCVFVYNLHGQLLMQRELNDSKVARIDLSTPPGYCLVKVVTNDGSQSKKVFIR